MRDFISRPTAFKTAEEICDRPSGIMMMLAQLKYVPAFAFLNKNWQIGSPRAKKLDSKTAENIMLVFNEKLIFDFMIVLSLSVPLSMSFDCSLIDGTMVTANELISVAGIMSIGNVMPMIIPNSDRASVGV